MEMNFCRRCGAALMNVQRHVYRCENEHILYANASPSVGVFFLSEDNRSVLLAVRGQEPSIGMLDAFGGLCDGKESAEDAVRRELAEELELSVDEYGTPTYLTSANMLLHYKNEDIPLLSLFYWTRLQTKRELVARDDVADMQWVSLHDVDLPRMHADDIRYGVTKLRELFT